VLLLLLLLHYIILQNKFADKPNTKMSYGEIHHIISLTLSLIRVLTLKLSQPKYTAGATATAAATVW